MAGRERFQMTKGGYILSLNAERMSGCSWDCLKRSLSTSAAAQDKHSKSSSSSSSQRTYTFKTLNVAKPDFGILQVELNRPDRLNAINKDAWREIRECFEVIALDSDCRVVILGGLGKHFCAGIDLSDIADLTSIIGTDSDPARKGFQFRSLVRSLQATFNAIEECPKPVIAAIHGGCIGAGVDMTSACDIRYCTHDAFFSIKEVDIGMAADVGTLQRFPKIVGNDSLVREFALTGRNFSASEASKIGFVSRTFDSRASMMSLALDVAKKIASKSPVAIQSTKINLNYSRDHSVHEGLQNQINWQGFALQTEDLMTAAMASADRSGNTIPKFKDI
ncbi:Delta(3,5)-Delta(2,4)-dienoyl-CoA isomerase, mitochondrial [Hypsibius exemplaris]|uniref:Delta(3,5)-Delta(2,4)-dienoyl-CoA isomerase, mitochondrial n=1 Tax=Hypsibius exemplaris TaxID=2072580 RepID=A0A1W0XB33_HYPEX|nr:Delta(3,5)-Delta(2,4)-dienoyl-CoA isomerase, mitochondrial [Hypsibius exemplaris]